MPVNAVNIHAGSAVVKRTLAADAALLTMHLDDNPTAIFG